MSDETTDKPSEPLADIEASAGGIRLVPLSDIDAFVEIRAGSIIDEAALLAIQFLGGRDGDRNEHFDTIGDAYDAKRWETAMIARRAGMMLARKRQREAAGQGGHGTRRADQRARYAAAFRSRAGQVAGSPGGPTG